MTVRWFLVAETAVFAMASLIHTGVLVHGYEHAAARTAETVIALVLLAGLLATSAFPARTRPIGTGAQGFALLGTLVGLFMIAIGVGPRTVLDLTIHGTMVTLLVPGLLITWRSAAGRAMS